MGRWRINQRVKIVSNEVYGYGKVGDVVGFKDGKVRVMFEDSGRVEEYDRDKHLRRVRKFD